MNRMTFPIRTEDNTTVLGLYRSEPRGSQNYMLNGAPCDLNEILGHVDQEHTAPLRALAVGDEHEIEQVGSPSLFVTRVR